MRDDQYFGAIYHHGIKGMRDEIGGCLFMVFIRHWNLFKNKDPTYSRSA